MLKFQHIYWHLTKKFKTKWNKNWERLPVIVLIYLGVKPTGSYRWGLLFYVEIRLLSWDLHVQGLRGEGISLSPNICTPYNLNLHLTHGGKVIYLLFVGCLISFFSATFNITMLLSLNLNILIIILMYQI